MKKYLYPILLILAIVSCKPKPATTNNAGEDIAVKKNNAKAKFHYTDSVFYKYASYLKLLDIQAPISATKAANKYVELFKGKDQRVCDTAFLIFNKFYGKLAESLEEINEKDSIDLDKYYGYLKKPAVTPAKVLAYVKDLQQNGFAITEAEGSMYISQDRDLVAKYFYDLVSPEMKEFLIQINEENKQVYMNDGSLIIGGNKIVDRAVWWEQFNKKHSGFIWRDEASSLKKEYWHILLKGSDNTEILLGDSNKLADYFKMAYIYLAQKYPSTETYKLIEPFYQLLLKGDKAKADALIESYEKRGVFSN